MDFREIEELIINLKGVLNCRITEDESQSINEIHIVADESRGAKQISRDIQSIFSAVYGITLDYKKISIAQIKGKIRDGSASRLKIKSIERNTTRSKYNAKIILEKDDEEYVGQSSGMNNFSLALRRTAEAALLAIEQFLGEDGILALDDVKVVNLSNTQIIAVVMTAFSEERGIEFCGCAAVDEDKYEATVRAVLNAIGPLVEKYINA